MTNHYPNDKLKIFSLNSNEPLAREVSEAIGRPLGKSSVNDSVMGKSKLISRKVSVAAMCLLSSQRQTLSMII